MGLLTPKLLLALVLTTIPGDVFTSTSLPLALTVTCVMVESFPPHIPQACGQ